MVVDLVLTGSPPKSSTAEASREATPHPDGTCNCDLDVGFLSALLYINPCYRRKGNREPGSADESGNRWLQGFQELLPAANPLNGRDAPIEGP